MELILFKYKVNENGVEGNDVFDCKYILLNPFLSRIQTNNYKDQDIFNKKKDYVNLKKIFKDIYSEIFNFCIDEIENDEKKDELSSFDHISSISLKLSTEKLNSYLIKFKRYKIIAKLRDYGQKIEYIKETENGKRIMGKYYDKEILFYDGNSIDHNYSFKNNDEIHFVLINELENNLIICGKENVTKLLYNQNNQNNIINIPKNLLPIHNLTILDINHCVCCNENGLYLLTDLSSGDKYKKCYTLDKKVYINIIKINSSLVALTSNKCLKNGQDKISFYNNKTKKLNDDILIQDNYSFTISKNNLTLVDISEKYDKREYKLLLCGCKKYLKGQKNGILLIIFNLENYEYYYKFYDTRNFEVFCFCQISKVKNTNKIFGEEIEKRKSKYFFVGGFDNNKRCGKIKLYKIIFNENIEKIEIEYIQDFYFGKDNSKYFQSFKGHINYIIQSKKTGNILINSLDDNIYLFSTPDLSLLSKKTIIKSIINN